MVGFEFWVYMLFKEDAECACACCLFELYVEGAPNVAADGTMQHDCHWLDSAGGTHYVANEQPPADASIQCPGVFGGDTQSSTQHAGERRSVPTKDGTVETQCIHYFYDSPAWPVYGMATHDLTWEYVGVVLDRCHDFALVEAGWLMWHEAGTAYSLDLYNKGPFGVADKSKGKSQPFKSPKDRPANLKPESDQKK